MIENKLSLVLESRAIIGFYHFIICSLVGFAAFLLFFINALVFEAFFFWPILINALTLPEANAFSWFMLVVAIFYAFIWGLIISGTFFNYFYMKSLNTLKSRIQAFIEDTFEGFWGFFPGIIGVIKIVFSVLKFVVYLVQRESSKLPEIFSQMDNIFDKYKYSGISGFWWRE